VHVGAVLLHVADQRARGEAVHERALAGLARIDVDRQREGPLRRLRLERDRTGLEVRRQQAVDDHASAAEERRQAIGRLLDVAGLRAPVDADVGEGRLQRSLQLPHDLLLELVAAANELGLALAGIGHALHQRHARIVADTKRKHTRRARVLTAQTIHTH
jgi:hypothetical protein